MGRQLRAGRVAVDAGARRGLPQRRRGETRFARGRRRPSRRRGHLLVRRRVSSRRGITWNARSRLFRPGRDDDLAFRFGLDAGVAAMVYLAIASWPLGEVDRAISLIERMQTRIAGLTHVGTLAFGKLHAALFELMRGDHARAAPNAFELARLAREHELPMCGRVWRVSRGLGDR